MTPIVVAACFHKEAWADQVATADALFGGERLLLAFLERAAAMRAGGRLLIVSPFLDARILQCSPVFCAECAAGIDLSLVTTPRAARSADVKAIAGLPWRSCEVRALSRLHAKLFAAVPTRGNTAFLLGSHNLTVGATQNAEAGVLLTGQSAAARLLAAQLLDHVAALRGQAHPIHDSLSWPSPMRELAT